MSTIQHYQKVGQEICVQLRVFIEHNAETDGLVFAGMLLSERLIETFSSSLLTFEGNSEFVTLPYYVLDYIFDFVPEKLWIFNCCRIDLADSSPNEYNFESNNLLSQTSKVFTCQPGQLAQVYSRFKSNSQEELEDVIMGDQIMKLLKCTDNIAQFVSTVHMNFKFIDQQAQINSNSYDLETSLFFLVQASERIQNYYGVKDLASVQFGIHKDHYYNFISTGRHFGNSFEQSPKKVASFVLTSICLCLQPFNLSLNSR